MRVLALGGAGAMGAVAVRTAAYGGGGRAHRHRRP